jgi:hypothetical protein
MPLPNARVARDAESWDHHETGSDGTGYHPGRYGASGHENLEQRRPRINSPASFLHRCLKAPRLYADLIRQLSNLPAAQFGVVDLRDYKAGAFKPRPKVSEVVRMPLLEVS